MPATPAKNQGPQKFGVYQNKSGSYTFGGNRFVPLKAVPVSAEAAALIDPANSPVVFYDTADAAAAAIKALSAKFAAAPKGQ